MPAIVAPHLGSKSGHLVSRAPTLALILCLASGCSSSQQSALTGSVPPQPPVSSENSLLAQSSTTKAALDETSVAPSFLSQATTTVASNTDGLRLVDVMPPTPELESLLWRASERLAKQCMHSQGFTYDELPPVDYVGQRKITDEMPGLTSDMASRVGYHTQLLPVPAAVKRAADAYNRVADANLARADSDPQFKHALVASDSGTDRGCRGQADSELYGVAGLLEASLPPEYADLPSSVVAHERNDTELTAALGDWQTCMQAKGYAFKGLGEGPAKYLNSNAVSDAERATAVADAGCRQSSGIETKLRQLESDAVQSWLDKNQSAILAERDLEKVLTQKALSVLSSG